MRYPSNKNLLCLEINLSIFEIRTNFSLAVKKVGSYTRGFTVEVTTNLTGKH